MKNRLIINSTVIILFASFVFLSAYENRLANINNQNIWMLYFSDTKSRSLDFAIENHSNRNDFHWEIYSDKSKVKEGNLSVAKGEIKKIPVSSEGIQDTKITISVTSDNNKKEIYKNL